MKLQTGVGGGMSSNSRRFGPMTDEPDWGGDSPPADEAPGEGRPAVVLTPRSSRINCSEEKSKEEVDPVEEEEETKVESKAVKVNKESSKFVPERVNKILEVTEDFGKFREKRIFKYLHLFCGPNDNLAEALRKECEKAGIKVEIESVDIKIDKNHDLKDTSNWVKWRDKVDQGEYDGTHAGFPCGSFSMVRWRPAEGMPKPVRSAEYPYGLPGNTETQQREADQGTLYATWSAKLMEKQSNSMRRRGVPEVCTLENPPGSEERFECPAWDLPEVRRELEKANSSFVEFHTCAYMSSERVRFYKPAKWGGKLEGLKSLSRVCRCPAWVQHKPVVGKTTSTAAGVYPQELCEAIAKLVVASWKRILSLEFWRYKCERTEEKVSVMQQKWLENEEKRLLKNEKQKVVIKIPPEKWTPSLDATNLEHGGTPKASVGDTKKELKAKEDEVYLGGMRNPRKAVEKLWKLKDAGGKVREVWKQMVKAHPEILELGRRYGAEDAKYNERLATDWKELLVEVVGLQKSEGVTLQDNWMFKSPLDGELWDAWCKFAGDPEHCLGEWVANGAPLGMNDSIQMSNNIFPPSRGKDAQDDQLPEIEAQVNTENYKSFLDQPDEASAEVKRLVEAGFAMVVTKEEAQERFGRGTVSRLALIVKDKPDGTRKRRVIVDMLRSGGNARATCPERIILPRIADVTEMTKDMFRRSQIKIMQGKKRSEEVQVEAELVSFDLQDAFCHFGISKGELRNSLAPLDEGHFLLFRAMLFGFRCAPLVMGRLSAAIGRLISVLCEPEAGQVQIYIDDILMVARGHSEERTSMISLVLYTLKALGVQISLRKGERGEQIKWIGVYVNLEWSDRDSEEKKIVYAVPKGMISEVKEALESWKDRGMIPLRDLRTVTGKLSWIAGIVVRMRWAVSVMYAVISSMEDDIRERAEDARAEKRGDDRKKPHLVAIKRFEIARQWLIEVMKDPDRMTIRSELLTDTKVEWVMVCDACPMGYGAVLAKPSREDRRLHPVEAFEAKFTESESKLLMVEWGQASSQGTLEALALWRSMKIWATKIQQKGILIRSDSTVALAMAEKHTSGSVSLNFLGGEIALLAEKIALPKLRTQHLSGKLNEEADWLSRGHEREKTPPEALRGLKIRKVGPVGEKDFALPPPGAESGSWVSGPHTAGVFRCL